MKKLLPILLAVLVLCGCQSSEKKAYGDEMVILREESVYTMSDGTEVDLWTAGMTDQELYCIDDEVNEQLLLDLLVVDVPKGPAGIENDGISFDDLAEPAKSAISRYYEEQGILYDTMEELELACEDYFEKKRQDDAFEYHYISQVVWPTGATEDLIAFCTELITYRGEKNVRQDWYNVVFDRRTGEVVPMESLFSAPLEDAKTRILDALMPEKLERSEKNLRAQMDEAFTLDYLKLMNDGIEVMFPVDSLECKEEAFGGFIPAEELAGVMDIWTE